MGNEHGVDQVQEKPSRDWGTASLSCEKRAEQLLVKMDREGIHQGGLVVKERENTVKPEDGTGT